jgi:hypothetical protein
VPRDVLVYGLEVGLGHRVVVPVIRSPLGRSHNVALQRLAHATYPKSRLPARPLQALRLRVTILNSAHV